MRKVVFIILALVFTSTILTSCTPEAVNENNEYQTSLVDPDDDGEG